MVDPSAVLAVMRAYRPKFKSKHDRLAFAVHAYMLAAGFRLIAAGASAEDDSGADQKEEGDIEGWNDTGPSYSFRYLDDAGGTIILKAIAMDDSLMVDATALDDKATVANTELKIDEFIGDETARNHAEQYINLEKLVARLDEELLPHLKPSAEKKAPDTAATLPRPGNEHPGPSGFDSSLRQADRVGDVRLPDVPEPRPYYGQGLRGPPVPLGVGGDDLNPFSGGPLIPPRPGGPQGGGLFVGPDHPIFGGGYGHPPMGMPPGGLPPGVPPGARFDPYGPPGVPGFEPDAFTRNGRAPMRGPRPPHPDLEHFSRGNDDIL